MVKLGEKGIIHILGGVILLIILIAGLAVGMYLIKHPTIFKSKAANPPILDALKITDTSSPEPKELNCDGAVNPPSCEITSPDVIFTIKDINALIPNNSGPTGSLFQFPKQVYAQSDTSCAQGNCNACETQTITVCGDQNAYAGDCDFATACKNNPTGKYTCRSRENPNGCSFDQYDCSACNSSITGKGYIDETVSIPVSKTCAEGNCSACATETLPVCGNQNVYSGDCNYATACKNNPQGKYACRSSQNPNGCSFDQYDCSLCDSSVTDSEKSPSPTASPTLTVTSLILDINGSKATLGRNYSHKAQLPISDLTQESIIPIKIDAIYSDGSSNPFYINFHYKPVTVPQPTTSDRIMSESSFRAENSPKEVGVLVMSYFPLDSTGKLDFDLTGSNESLSGMRAHTSSLTQILINDLTKATIYHGYKDMSAKPALNFKIIDQKEFLKPVPVTRKSRGAFRDTIDSSDYKKMLNDINICDYVDNKGVKQVWVWSYHTPRQSIDESNVSMGYKSKIYWNFKDFGDVSNSLLFDDLPICQSTYALFNYNFSRSIGEALEDHGHHLEVVLKYIDYDLFWNKFVKPNGSKDPLVVNHCGWVHSSPNVGDDSTKLGVYTRGGQYDWVNEASVKSDCEDWKPDGGGSVQTVNCHTWYAPYTGLQCPGSDTGAASDGGRAYKIWWMQNLPGMNNYIPYKGGILRNWWAFYADFDSAIKEGRSLYIKNK